MDNQAAFRVIRPGQDARTLLAIDSGLGMAEASFPELAQALDTECTVRESLTGTDVETWLREIDTCGYDVRGVFGYCSGASLACVLADRIIDNGWATPGVVLFDPVAVSQDQLWYIFLRFVRTFAEELGPEGMGRARAFSRDTVARHGSDLVALADALLRGYEPIVRAAAGPLDLPEDIVEDFIGRLDAELTYMLAASRHPLSTRHAKVASIYSNEATPSDIPGSSQFWVDVPRFGLFSSPDVVEATMRMLDPRDTAQSRR